MKKKTVGGGKGRGEEKKGDQCLAKFSRVQKWIVIRDWNHKLRILSTFMQKLNK